MKRFLAIALALVLVLSFTVTAFAEVTVPDEEEEDTVTYSITAATNLSEKHTYEVYQIFTGDLSDDGTTLSNIRWGTNGTGTPDELLDDDELTELEELVASLEGKSEVDIANAMAEYLDDNTDPVGTITSSKTSLSGLAAGYYLIKDQDGSLDDEEGEAYTLFVFQVLNNVTFTPKTGTTTSEKKVDDINDSDGNTEELQDSADYDIGDDIPYTLTANLAGNVHDYQTYHITFVDTLEAGTQKNNKDYTITVNGDVVYENGETSSDFDGTVTIDNSTDNGFAITLEWAAGENKQLNEDNDFDLDDAEITLTFTAELLEGANIGSEGNINTMYLKYSNNPNDKDGGDEGQTPEDTVIVFTYKVVVNKVQPNPDYDPDDEDSEEYIPLAGAAFSLYKKYEAAPEDAEECEDEDYAGYYLVEAIEAGSDTSFEFVGIDDGDYVLIETTTPNGYNSIDPIPFTVTAEHQIEINPYVDDNRTTYLEELNGESTGDIELVFNPIAEDEDALTTDVINRSGVVLPSTGGIGTTIFYVVGGCLAAAAIILLITKKRMSQEG